jgi:hypothetical protein
MTAFLRRRLPVLLGAALSAGVLLSQFAGAQAVSTVAPSIYGWWSQTGGPTGRITLARPGPRTFSLRVKASASPSQSARPAKLRAEPDGVGQPDSTRRIVGTTLGTILLLLCILYWSDGYGALGVRSSLAARHQERKR